MSRNQRAEAQHRWEEMRGDVKRQLAQQHLVDGRLDDAEQALEQAVTLSPDDPQSYLLTAKLRLEEGRLAEAREAITLATSMAGDDAEIAYFAGIIAERYGDLQTAMGHYSTATMLAPNVAAYVLAQAETLVALGKPAEALAIVQPRWRDFDGDAPTHMLTARLSQMLGLRGPAAEQCREALRWGDDDVMRRAEAGRILVWAEAYPEAIAVLRPLVEGYSAGPRTARALRDDDAPNGIQASIFCALAKAYIATGRFREARECLGPLLDDRREQGAVAGCLLARAALHMGDPDGAADAIAVTHRKGPVTPQTLLLAAYADLRRGRHDGAMDAANAALKLDPGLIGAHCLIGQAAVALGRPDQAREAYEDALALDPDSRVVRALIEKLGHEVMPENDVNRRVRPNAKARLEQIQSASLEGEKAP